MAVTGFTFDKAIVPANRDSILYDKFNFGRSSVVKGRYNDMELTSNGLNVTVDTGYAIVQGRLIEISSPEIIPVPANTTGYIAITIDLSQENQTTGTPGQPDYTFQLNQGKVGFVKTLVSEDTNDGRPIFTLQLARVSSNGADVTITKNWDVYNNYVMAPDGIVFGDNVTNYGSALIGNKWYSGGQTPQDLIIAPSSGKRLLIQNDSGGNGDLQAGTATITGIKTPSVKTGSTKLGGLTINFRQTVVGVNVYMDGSFQGSFQMTDSYVSSSSVVPNNIDRPRQNVVLTIIGNSGVGGVTTNSPWKLEVLIGTDGKIKYRAKNLRDNDTATRIVTIVGADSTFYALD